MADHLHDVFARFEASVAPTFRPVPVTELSARRRSGRPRRLRAGLLAGVLVLVAGGPVGALTFGASSPDAAPEAPVRDIGQIRLPGWEHRAPAQFGYAAGTLWAYGEGRCAENVCVDSELATSTDDGMTWRARPGGREYRDARLIVSPLGNVYLREQDSGTIARVLPDTGESVLTPALPGPRDLLVVNGGDLILECPGQETYGGQEALACDRPEIADLTGAVEPVAPAGMGRLTQLAPDGRGRTWLLGHEPESRSFWLSSSADGGRTWGTPVRRESAAEIRLAVSPIDGDAWLVAGDPVRAWAVTHDGDGPVVAAGDGRGVARAGGSHAEVTQFDDAKASMIRALGDGVLAVATPGDGVWVVQPDEGRGPVVDDFVAVDMAMHADGGLFLRDADGRVVISAGRGWERSMAWPVP
ncbi:MULTISPECIES: hypothetical protein [Catenuloplanes]|uniref:Uncharacterized protein n=1 Tax=Catenuloplanes niger TaxID=587534 RepID=A0AAE3ZUG5_9ACTN|nr:hypothetical protein [Catenuloplanes niger]MDR7325314.1 hypothetical protein [Catenuloplanes niger]